MAAFSSENWNPIGTGFSRANPEKKIHKLDLSDHDAVTALLDEVKSVPLSSSVCGNGELMIILKTESTDPLRR